MEPSETISSVVAPAECESEKSPATTELKRQQSEEVEQDGERQRTGSGKNSPITTEDAKPGMSSPEEARTTKAEPVKPAELADTGDSRRKRSVVQEKQRNKRLFGALLGNLTQPSDRVSKRRTEIEQRRKAELQKQDDERLEDRQRRLERLTEHRKQEQEKLDAESMHLRHSQMLNQAHFLLTENEPKLYYRPWELLPHQEDIIDDQIRAVKVKIDEELSAFEARKRSSNLLGNSSNESTGLTDHGEQSEELSHEATETANGNAENCVDSIDADQQELPKTTGTGMTGASRPSLSSDEMNRAAASLNSSKNEHEEIATSEKKDEEEDEGDHVVEGGEDTVIY